MPAQAPKVELLNKEHKLLGEPENPEVDVAADAYKLQRSLLTGLRQEVRGSASSFHLGWTPVAADLKSCSHAAAPGPLAGLKQHGRSETSGGISRAGTAI